MSELKMNIFILLFLLGAQRAAAGVIHTMQYFYTSSSGVPNFPEFVVVGYVDGVLMVHYDSNSRKAEPKQDWMEKVTADNPQYLKGETGKFLGDQQTFIANIEIAKQRFNQTGGVHVFQVMYGCEWDDETGDVNGYQQFGYDGEDFISLDLKNEVWVAPKPQAVITKHKWDNDKAWLAGLKNYHTQECPEWLKKYLNYGRSSLLRTVLPSVSLLQKSPSSAVCCHATGFYPDKADIFWRKEGHQLHEDVDHGELLPNHNGTFQMSVDLDLSSVKPEDWGKYECVFQLAGEKDLITKLDKAAIRSNGNLNPGDGGFPVGSVVGVVVALLILVLCVAAVLVWKRKKNGAKCPPSADSSSEASQQLNPKVPIT